MAVNDALNIRPVVSADLEAWRTLWDGYNAFYGRNGPTALPEEVTAVTWARFFNPLEPVFALVAENEGKLLGLAHYLFHRSTTRVEPVCYLQDLFTASPARGQGGAARSLRGSIGRRSWPGRSGCIGKRRQRTRQVGCFTTRWRSTLASLSTATRSRVPPNPTLNRMCNSVRRPGLISLWPGRRPLPHAG